MIGLAVGLLDFENLENAFFFLPEKKLFKTKTKLMFVFVGKQISIKKKWLSRFILHSAPCRNTYGPFAVCYAGPMYRALFFLEPEKCFLIEQKRSSIFFHGPRVTEVTKLEILYQLEDWEYDN